MSNTRPNRSDEKRPDVAINMTRPMNTHRCLEKLLRAEKNINILIDDSQIWCSRLANVMSYLFALLIINNCAIGANDNYHDISSEKIGLPDPMLSRNGLLISSSVFAFFILLFQATKYGARKVTVLDSCNISLLSLKKDQEPVKNIDKITLQKAQNENKPILIKTTNNNYFIYGDAKGNGKWELTKIDAKNMDFNKLPFAQKILTYDNKLFDHALIKILKKGHAPFNKGQEKLKQIVADCQLEPPEQWDPNKVLKLIAAKKKLLESSHKSTLFPTKPARTKGAAQNNEQLVSIAVSAPTTDP